MSTPRPSPQGSAADLRAEDLLREERDLGLALAAATTLDEGLRLCLAAALRISGLDGGGIYGVDPVSGSIALLCHTGLSDEFARSVGHFEADTAEARLILAGQPIYGRWEGLSPALGQAERREGLRALAVLPVRHEERVIACLNLASHAADEVAPAVRVALEAIAGRTWPASRARPSEAGNRG